MTSIRESIRRLVVGALDLPAETEVQVGSPPDPSMGDYAVGLFPFAKALRRAPPQLAAQVAAGFTPGGGISEVAAAGPYVNVRVDRGAFLRSLFDEILGRGERYGTGASGAGRTVVIDFSSPNISKHLAFHHIRSTVIGHALCNLYAACGWKVVGFNFLGDWGTTHGMLLAAWDLWGGGVDLDHDGVTKLNQLYVKFRAAAKEDPALDDAARAWFKRLEGGDERARALWERFREVSLAEFDRIYEKLGVRFDALYGESFYEDRMEPVLADLAAAGLLTESEGATVVDLEDAGMPPCLLRKKDGTTLYATRDLASARHRFEEFGADLALYVVGKEQTLHFRQWFAVAEKAGFSCAGKMRHLPFGQIRLGGAKAGTRTGNVILLNEALERAADHIDAVIAEKNPEMDAAKRREVAKQVGYGSIVFGDLTRERERDWDFDWDRLLSFEGDTGPYCQYQHARIASIVRKSGLELEGADPTRLGAEEEWQLALLLAEFPDRVQRAVDRDEPCVVASYVLDLCRAFSSWYALGSKDPALKVNCDDPDTARARLLLARSVQQTLANALGLLGLAAPDEM